MSDNGSIFVSVRFKKEDDEFDVDFNVDLGKEEENWYQEYMKRNVSRPYIQNSGTKEWADQPGRVSKQKVTNDAISGMRQIDKLHPDSPGTKYEKCVGVLTDVLTSLEMHEVVSTFRSINGPDAVNEPVPISINQKEYEEMIDTTEGEKGILVSKWLSHNDVLPHRGVLVDEYYDEYYSLEIRRMLDDYRDQDVVVTREQRELLHTLISQLLTQIGYSKTAQALVDFKTVYGCSF